MAKYEVAVRLKELEREIPDAEAKLAHMINRRREIDAYDAPNREYKRKLLAKYRLEIKSATERISNLKTELWGLQELDYK
jgi:hypothetical protein